MYPLNQDRPLTGGPEGSGTKASRGRWHGISSLDSAQFWMRFQSQSVWKWRPPTDRGRSRLRGETPWPVAPGSVTQCCWCRVAIFSSVSPHPRPPFLCLILPPLLPLSQQMWVCEFCGWAGSLLQASGKPLPEAEAPTAVPKGLHPGKKCHRKGFFKYPGY